MACVGISELCGGERFSWVAKNHCKLRGVRHSKCVGHKVEGWFKHEVGVGEGEQQEPEGF